MTLLGNRQGYEARSGRSSPPAVVARELCIINVKDNLASDIHIHVQ